MKFLGKIARIFRSIWVSALMVVILALIAAGKIYFASEARRTPPAPKSPAPATSSQDKTAVPKTVTEEFGEKFANFVLPANPAPASKAEKGPPPLPDDIKKRLVNPPTAISLFPPLPEAKLPRSAPPPDRYLPSFRIIHCELIAGPQTGNIETPLIGVVLENQFNIDADGVSRLVIPAGVEVHGLGKSSPVRDRIDGAGKWTFVWRTEDGDNGMELAVNALALNRDFDETKRVYGDTEKSPGIVGRRFQSTGDMAIEEALLDSVAAVSRSLKSYTALLNPLTSQVVNQARPTFGNALLDGAGAGTDRLAQMVDDIRKQIDEKGYYVAVLPGKEFYLYTREPIDLRKARRPAAVVMNEPVEPAPAKIGAPHSAAKTGAP